MIQLSLEQGVVVAREDLTKAEADPVGTVRNRSSGKYKKVSEGNWQRVTESRGKGSEDSSFGPSVRRGLLNTASALAPPTMISSFTEAFATVRDPSKLLNLFFGSSSVGRTAFQAAQKFSMWQNLDASQFVTVIAQTKANANVRALISFSKSERVIDIHDAVLSMGAKHNLWRKLNSYHWQSLLVADFAHYVNYYAHYASIPPNGRKRLSNLLPMLPKRGMYFDFDADEYKKIENYRYN